MLFLFLSVQDKTTLLIEELKLSEMIANRYHSNYHAWSHRMWSLQHLIPDSPFSNLRKKLPNTPFFEMIQAEASDLNNCTISRFEFSNFNNYQVSHIFFEELENNFKWVSSHVSDHSGLHFRTFLLSEILFLMKIFFSLSHKNEFQSEYHYPITQSNLIPSVFINGKVNISEFLNCYAFGSNQKRAVNNYLLKLEEELTLLDVALFFIITEMKSNYSLLLMFPNHEALWCYRRFLIHSYKTIIFGIDSCTNKLDQKISVHQDKNGVPCRKDFKYDHTQDTDTYLKHSNLFIALYSKLLSNEEEFTSKISSTDEYVKTLVQNYNQWLSHCLKNIEK